MLICPSSVRLSKLRGGGGGGGVYLRNASVTFLLCWHGASLGWHKSHIDRFGWIALKVIFKVGKVKVGPFCTRRPFAQKLFSNFFLYFCIELPRKGTNELPKDGFAWITLKVFFKVGKVRFCPFLHIYLCYSVVLKCCPFFCTKKLHWSVNTVVKYKCCAVTLKVIFKVRKVEFGPLWSICTNISEMVHDMTKVYMKHL